MKILTFVVALFFGVVLVFAIAKLSGNEVDVTVKALAAEYKEQNGTQSFESKATGSMGDGDAVLELTPKMINRNRLLVKFSVNTHSVSLSGYDLKEMATLEYNNKVLKPVKASRIGGHHSSGTVLFEVDEDISSFTIKIKGMPGIEERIYEWSVG
jgi:hypothetical protein